MEMEWLFVTFCKLYKNTQAYAHTALLPTPTHFLLSMLVTQHKGYMWKRRYQWCPVETFAKKIQQEIEQDRSTPE